MCPASEGHGPCTAPARAAAAVLGLNVADRAEFALIAERKLQLEVEAPKAGADARTHAAEEAIASAIMCVGKGGFWVW